MRRSPRRQPELTAQIIAADSVSAGDVLPGLFHIVLDPWLGQPMDCLLKGFKVKIILDELCALTHWHRDHTRKVLRRALVLRQVTPRAPRPPLYGEPVIEALRFIWAVQGTPCGRLLAAALPDLVPRLRRLSRQPVG